MASPGVATAVSSGATDPTARFGDRVDAYVRARPGYPAAVIDLLRSSARLGPGTVVADLGAGTGIFTRMLAETGATVHAVEPNLPMREVLVAGLGATTAVRVHGGTAEATGLAGAGVDLITAAQAFHWFDPEAVGPEFRRILRPGGRVALVWNERVATTAFLVAYDRLVGRWATDHRQVDRRRVDAGMVEGFFAPRSVELHTFEHGQVLDLDGVRDRLLSSSYAPAEGHPDREPMVAGLSRIFAEYQDRGVVRFEYRTQVYVGRFGS